MSSIRAQRLSRYGRTCCVGGPFGPQSMWSPPCGPSYWAYDIAPTMTMTGPDLRNWPSLLPSCALTPRMCSSANALRFSRVAQPLPLRTSPPVFCAMCSTARGRCIKRQSCGTSRTLPEGKKSTHALWPLSSELGLRAALLCLPPRPLPQSCSAFAGSKVLMSSCSLVSLCLLFLACL